MSEDAPVSDANAPPGLTAAELAHAQAEALNAAADDHLAPAAHSGGTDSQIVTLLMQNQRQLAELLIEQRNERVVFQQMLAGAPTPVRSSARHDSTITTAYDIHKPGIIGTMSARDIKPNSALDLVKGISALDWLMAIEQACKFYRVDYPAAFASSHLVKEANTIFNAAFMDRDVYTITWVEFREWLLNSSLHDRLADQKLLDNVAGLQQGNLSVKDYTDKCLKFYGKRNTHPILATYPEIYWVETVKRGFHYEIKSRLSIVDSSTTLASITAQALNIGVPLEEAGVLRLASTTPNFQLPFRDVFRAAGGLRGRVRGTGLQGGGRGQPNGLNGPAGQLNGMAGQNSTPTPSRVGAATTRDNPARGQFQAALEYQLNALANSAAPPPTIDEKSLAIWERANLGKGARRAARSARGACAFCGLSGHLIATCPEVRGNNGLNTFSDQGPGEYFDINSGGVTYPNAPGMVQE